MAGSSRRWGGRCVAGTAPYSTAEHLRQAAGGRGEPRGACLSRKAPHAHLRCASNRDAAKLCPLPTTDDSMPALVSSTICARKGRDGRGARNTQASGAGRAGPAAPPPEALRCCCGPAMVPGAGAPSWPCALLPGTPPNGAKPGWGAHKHLMTCQPHLLESLLVVEARGGQDVARDVEQVARLARHGLATHLHW